jgi:hypothetical protein
LKPYSMLNDYVSKTVMDASSWHAVLYLSF